MLIISICLPHLRRGKERNKIIHLLIFCQKIDLKKGSTEIPMDNLRQRIFAAIKECPSFQVRNEDLTLHEYRDVTLKRLQEISSYRFIYDENNEVDSSKVYVLSDILHSYDFSLGTKMAVQYGLFAGTIAALGTVKHHWILNDAFLAMIPGCFAMTEFAHGSDVQSIETTATFVDDGFVICTPNNMAQKYWIGNAAQHALYGVVFAQLIMPNGESKGVHAFLVKFRDTETSETSQGIHIEDCGLKGGLNGVDNGRIWFDNVKVPYDALLDRFAYIDDGVYLALLKKGRFGALFRELTSGRIGAASAGCCVSEIALRIALGFANWRTQFETKLIDFRTHQLRLIPLIAAAFAYRAATEYIKREYAQTNEITKELHAQSAAIKALATWNAFKTAQECRECCGGHGYSWYNKLVQMRNDVDIYCTLEGDNTVMLQQAGRYLLLKFKYSSAKYKIREYFSLKIPVKISISNLLEYRIRCLTYTTARSQKRDLLPLVTKLGMAYGCYIAFRELKNLGFDKRLSALYGFWVISQDFDFFGRFVNPTYIWNKIKELSYEIAPKALDLTDLFMAPMEVVDAPITTESKLKKSQYFQRSNL
jgi:alkylation response protein AidB-like acyl-CoA dehydrogenase